VRVLKLFAIGALGGVCLVAVVFGLFYGVAWWMSLCKSLSEPWNALVFIAPIAAVFGGFIVISNNSP
jgi:hypothetical protein